MLEFTLAKPNTGEYKEKGSSFHAILKPASSVNHVKSILLTLKEQFSDATHICYAYRMRKGKNLDEYSSDAGEPIGSAGIPILNVLKRNQIVNAVLFVIRYFGGTKLGITGLIYAYGASAADAIENAMLKKWLEKRRLAVTYSYKLDGIMKSIFLKNQAKVIHENFGEKIDIKLEIDVESTDKFLISIKESSAGSAKIIMED